MDQAKIAEWRAKAAAGTITIEEMREAILMLRENRMSAVSKQRTAARKQVKSAEELLKELESQC